MSSSVHFMLWLPLQSNPGWFVFCLSTWSADTMNDQDAAAAKAEYIHENTLLQRQAMRQRKNTLQNRYLPLAMKQGPEEEAEENTNAYKRQNCIINEKKRVSE